MASNGEAVGLLETRGLVCHIAATDAMCKAAERQDGQPGADRRRLHDDAVRGDVGSVRAAVDAGAQAASKTGELVTAHVIPRPERAIIDLFAK